MPSGDRRVGPAGLLEYLPDGEGFEQVPVLGEDCGRGLSDLLRGKGDEGLVCIVDFP